MIREIKNPLITPSDVKPSNKDMKVDCAFNAGITEYDDEIIMLLRVAESAKEEKENMVTIPVIGEDKKLSLVELSKSDEKYDFGDSRQIFEIATGSIAYLTSLSHLRVARSKDGINFEVEDTPFIFPSEHHETWGVEDPRITKIDDLYYINYTAVSPFGAATALVTTEDFINYERKGIIFPSENKDVSLFPEKINGKYIAYHRPVPKSFGSPDMWISESEDLVHWGNHRHLLGTREGSWENGRIGGGAPSFKTDKGWIHIYHAADKENRYCLGAFITPLDSPGEIISKTELPFLEPEEKYETEGFFGNVVFTCGLIVKEDVVNIYYGAADECMALATIKIEELYERLGL